MEMENGGDRPDRDGLEADSSESWYFNLPSGAWERQEAKNRALRERVHSNLNDRRQEDDEPEPEPEPELVLERLADEHPEPFDIGFEDDSDEEWSTEPPFILDEEPETPAAPQSAAEPPSPRPFLLRNVSPEPAREQQEEDSPWDSNLGGNGAEEGGLAAMRAWASRGREAERRHFLSAVPQDTGDADVTPAEPEPGLEQPQEAANEVEAKGEPIAAPGGPPAPEREEARSRWDEMFSRPAESDGLAAMRAWASKPQDEPEPRPRLILDERNDEPERPLRPEQLEPFDWEKDLAPPPAVPPELLEPFEWEKEEPVVDAEVEALPEEEPLAETVVAQPAEPHDSELPAMAALEAMVQAERPTPKRRGFFGRLFGRKHEDDETLAPDPGNYEGDWVEIEPQDNDVRTVALAGGEDSDDADTGWEPAPFSPADIQPQAMAPGTGTGEDSIEAEGELIAQDRPEASFEVAEPLKDETGTVEAAEATEPAFETADAAGTAETIEPEFAWSPEPFGETEAEPVATLAEFEPSSDDDAMGWEPEPPAGDAPEANAAHEPVTEAPRFPGWEPEASISAPDALASPAEDVAAEDDTAGQPLTALEEQEDEAPAALLAPTPSVEAATDEDPWTDVAAIEEDAESAAPGQASAEGERAAEAEAAPLPTLIAAKDDDAWSDITQAEEAVAAEPETAASPVQRWNASAVPAGGAPAEQEEETRWPDFADESGDGEDAAPAAWLLVPEPQDEDIAAISEQDAAPGALASESPVAPRLLTDDPWADFFAAQGSGDEQPGEAEQPAAQRPADSWTAEEVPAEKDPYQWETSEQPATEDASDEAEDSWVMPEQPAAEETDDPWAAIAAASGYSAASPGGVAVYRGPNPDDEAAVFEAPEPYEQPLAEARPFTDTAEASEATASADTGGWQEDGDDVVLRAFERHAATPDPDEAPAEEKDAFKQLLGEDADDIVDNTPDLFAEPMPFGRLTQWAPQRSGRTSVPSQVGWDGTLQSPAPAYDDEETVPGWDADDDTPIPPPPWAGDEAEERPEPGAAARSGRRVRTLVRELVETGLLALLVFLSVRASFQNFKVDGTSMYPTLENGQFLIVNKLEYAEVDMKKLSNFVPFVDPGSNPKRAVFHEPQRGDIVVLRDPRNPEIDLIKRVVGLPGETVEIAGGHVYINDHLLEEPYIKSPWHDNKPKISIPAGEYFVMGDNRDNSLDSRILGLVPKDLIIGKAMLSYWPLGRFGLAPNESGDISLKDGPPRLTAQLIPAGN